MDGLGSAVASGCRWRVARRYHGVLVVGSGHVRLVVMEHRCFAMQRIL